MDRNEQKNMQAAMTGIEQMTETVRGMVAALVNDGFTPAQARDIVAGVFRAVK